MTPDCELRLNRSAAIDAPRPLRHALDAFLVGAQIPQPAREDIIIAVGEALSNAVEHAYGGDAHGAVELYARTGAGSTLLVDVVDRGRFIERDGGTPGRGLGLRIVRAIAREVTIETNGGTSVRMVFDVARLAG